VVQPVVRKIFCSEQFEKLYFAGARGGGGGGGGAAAGGPGAALALAPRRRLRCAGGAPAPPATAALRRGVGGGCVFMAEGWRTIERTSHLGTLNEAVTIIG
jgi:hypothetical protein